MDPKEWKCVPAPPLAAFRRDRSLCNTLVHGKTNKLLKTGAEECECGCQICDIIHREPVQDTDLHCTHQAISRGSCRQRNMVYAITCDQSRRVVYVGETVRQIRERMIEHIRDVRLMKDKSINDHLGQNHSADMLRFAILESLYAVSHTERQTREYVWLKRLKMVKPYGCNVKDVYLPAHFIS